MQNADQRVVAGAPALLSWQLIGNDGDPADPGSVTVTVTRADGTVVVTGQATAGTGTAARTYTLAPAQTRTIDSLSVVWSVGGDAYRTQQVAVVGGLWFSNAALRAARPEVSDPSRFPASTLADARAIVEARFESWTNQAWVPTLAAETLPGTGRAELPVTYPTVRAVRSVTFLTDGAVVGTLSPSECAAIPASESGLLCRSAGWALGETVRVVYEHGRNVPTVELKALAMRVTAELLAKAKGGGLPENAISYASSELGMSIVLATPGVRGAVSTIPDVNECIPRHTWTTLGIA